MIHVHSYARKISVRMVAKLSSDSLDWTCLSRKLFEPAMSRSTSLVERPVRVTNLLVTETMLICICSRYGSAAYERASVGGLGAQKVRNMTRPVTISTRSVLPTRKMGNVSGHVSAWGRQAVLYSHIMRIPRLWSGGSKRRGPTKSMLG